MSLLLGTFAFSLAGGIVPVPNVEAYAVSVAAGVARMRFGRFFAVGLTGRLVRFAAVFLVPRLA